jgi:hypothetical protein
MDFVVTEWEVFKDDRMVGQILASAQGVKVRMDDEWLHETAEFGQFICQLIIAYDEYDSLRPKTNLVPG